MRDLPKCSSPLRKGETWSCNRILSAQFVARACALCRRLKCSVFHCDNMHTSPLIGAAVAQVPVRIWYKRSMNAHFEECRGPGWRERLAVSTRLSCCLATRVGRPPTAKEF